MFVNLTNFHFLTAVTPSKLFTHCSKLSRSMIAYRLLVSSGTSSSGIFSSLKLDLDVVVDEAEVEGSAGGGVAGGGVAGGSVAGGGVGGGGGSAAAGGRSADSLLPSSPNSLAPGPCANFIFFILASFSFFILSFLLLEGPMMEVKTVQ